MKTTRTIGALSCIALGMTLGDAAHADLSVTASTTTSSYVSPAGLGSAAYVSVAAASATTAQGQPSAASSGTVDTVLSETFTPSTSYTLAGFDLLLSGINGVTVGVQLYDVTTALSSSNGSTTQSSGATYNPNTAPLTDLFGGGAGLSFTTPGESGAYQEVFSLSNGTTYDQVSLVAGDTYALELLTPATSGTAGNVNWVRGGAVATDGEMMGAHDASAARLTLSTLGLAGGAPRTGSLATFAVAPAPEPTTFALLGGALVVGGLLRRPNK
jgi:hypothetical protein